MSGRLVDEVLECAPDDLTSAQMLLLVALAEDARERDRIARFETSVVDLQRRTRLKSGTVRNGLSALVSRGLITPLHRARLGTVQHYRLSPLHEHHRGSTITPPEETP